MGGNSTEEEKKYLLGEIRNALLLALRYTHGENANCVRVCVHIREGLVVLEKLEESIT